MQVKHIEKPSDIDMVCELIDMYFKEREELALGAVTSNMVINSADEDSVDYKTATLIFNTCTQQIKDNNHEADLLDKMLRYLQLMETNNKLDYYRRNYSNFFNIVIADLWKSLRYRTRYMHAIAGASLKGTIYDTTDVNIITNIDLTKPHLTTEVVDGYINSVPSVRKKNNK